jgi:hypothetical protein
LADDFFGNFFRPDRLKNNGHAFSPLGIWYDQFSNTNAGVLQRKAVPLYQQKRDNPHSGTVPSFTYSL